MPYDVICERLDSKALYDLRGPRAALRAWAGDALPAFPDRPNSWTEAAGATLLFIGPDHWLLCADLATEEALDAVLRPAGAPPEISVVRVSDTLAWFRITGTQAAEVMAVACPMDLHESRFGPDGASFTEAFGLRALVTRCEGGFDLAIEQSYGPMVTDYLSCITA